MKFHLPSFLLGCATGAVGKGLAPRVRPIALELGTAAYRFLDALGMHAARRREDLADLLAEARARADAIAAEVRRAATH
jgi:hypothetical protein